MLDAARALAGTAPEIVVNTHSDGDHVWGNQLLAGARIVSTAKARRLMTLDTPAELRRLQRLGRLLARLPRASLRRLGEELAPFDWSEVELTLPGETFDGELEVEVGGRAIRLIEVGPAHTEGDAVVWAPDVAVCFAADILFIGCTPITWAGPVAGWLAAIDRISALGAAAYVPGHGPICGQAEVDQLRGYLEWVAAEGVALLERGVAPAKAARSMLLSAEFDSSPWSDWDDPARLLVTLSTERHRRDGGEGHLAGGGRTRAVMRMGALRAELERRR
jgi:cyclase